jgi:hypothetical protein
MEDSLMPMNIEKALEIVITLASENALDDCQVDDDPEILSPMKKEQDEAIKLVNGFLYSGRRIPFRIGSDLLPGFSKLIEEMGELNQVIGKIQGLGHMGEHWDGAGRLDRRLQKEIADVRAAIAFIERKNLILPDIGRENRKLARFEKWHDNIQAGRDPNEGVEYDEDEHDPTRT